MSKVERREIGSKLGWTVFLVANAVFESGKPRFDARIGRK